MQKPFKKINKAIFLFCAVFLFLGLTTSAIAITTATTYNLGATTLRLWSKGEPVKELQRFLNDKLNLGLVIDGKLGPKTVLAVKQWQKINNLMADGLVGPKTRAKISELSKISLTTNTIPPIPPPLPTPTPTPTPPATTPTPTPTPLPPPLPPPIPASISASPTTVEPSGTVTVTVSNAPGSTTDWVGLYSFSATESGNGANVLDWKYLNNSQNPPSIALKNATVTFTAPNVGEYNFRLFADNGWSLLATSPNVTVKLSSYVYLSDNNGPNIDTADILSLSGNNPFLQGTATSTPWTFAQWGNPYPFSATTSSPNVGCTSAPAWANATPNGRICWIKLSDGTYKVEIAQAGSNPPYNLDCGSGNTEFDLFLGNNPNMAPVEFQKSPKLSELSALNVAFNLQLPYVNVNKYCNTPAVNNPWVDQASPLFSLVLSSTSGQTFFYQLELSSYLSDGTVICQRDGPGWFFAPDPNNPSWYGADEWMGTAFGVPCPSSQTQSYNLDFLPRLIYDIQNSPGAMDKDISHWQVGKFYFGSHVFGGGIMTTLWDHIGIVGQLK